MMKPSKCWFRPFCNMSAILRQKKKNLFANERRQKNLNISMGANPSRNTNITRRLRPFCCCLATLEQNFKTISMPHTALRDVYFYIAHLNAHTEPGSLRFT